MRDKLHGVEHLYLDDGSRPISVSSASIIGLVAHASDADNDTFPLNTAVLSTGTSLIAKAGTQGTLRTALLDINEQQRSAVVVVRVEEGSDENTTIANIIGTIDNETNSFTGLQALLTFATKPRLIIAPGYSHLPAVGAALETMARKLRGIAIIDGQADGFSAAVQDRAQYSEALFVDPGIRLFDVDAGDYVTRPASSAVAGHIVRIDTEFDYSHSPSNRRMNTILGTSVAVDHREGDKASLSNQLSANDIACVIEKEGGAYFWGNRLSNGVLIPHQRIRYIVGDSILEAHADYVDRKLTSNYATFIIDRVNSFLRRLTLSEIISGGECWLDPELNLESFPDNTAYFDYQIGFYNVAETLVFRQSTTDEYTNDIISAITTN